MSRKHSFKITKGPLKGRTIEMGTATHEALIYEIAEVLFDLEECFVSDESHPSDFLGWGDDTYINGETLDGLRKRFFDFYGVELPKDDNLLYFGKLASLLLGED